MTEALPTSLDKLFSQGQEVFCKKGDVLKKQFSRVDRFYILLEGTVHFHQSLHSNDRELLAGMSQSLYAPIGMDAFIAPYRNETTARVASDTARLIKWETEQLIKCLDADIHLAIDFFTFLNNHSHRFVEDTSELFANTSAALQTLNTDSSSDGYLAHIDRDEIDKVILLLQSPFFEEFDEKDLAVLASSMQRREYLVNEIVISQDEKKKGIFLLESGEVQYSRMNFSIETNKTYKVPFRSISTPGYLLSSSSLLGIKSAMTSHVTKEAVVLYIPKETLEKHCKEHPNFALSFQKRILWLINNQLRAVRTRLIATQFNEELLVASTLISSNSTKLSVHSPLHAVPVLLEDKLTIPQAIEVLHKVELTGIGPEKNLASLCLDNLHKTQRESNFYRALQDIYSSVAENTEEKTNDEVQLDCIKASKKAFSIPSIYIKGLEYMPNQPGCIFIYNHLLNEPYYTLPNQFQITLDSHYLSALVYENYGAHAQRVVRIGKSDEYAHENYYNKLGFISVYTNDSDELIETEEERKSRHQVFYDQIKDAILSGKNIIISPEGSSHPTEHSPSKFKSGIFKVIQQLEVQPLIVPIVMANFDKRITAYKFACEIKKPFRLNEKMKELGTSDIKEFLRKYQLKFRQDTQELTDNIANENSAQLLFQDEIDALKEKVTKLPPNDTVAFYGSSTIRLWESLEGDLADKKAVNLGFGGSSYQWCLFYFERLFENFLPKSYVLYGGDNDLSIGQSPSDVLMNFSLLYEKIKRHSPHAPITVISIKPSPSREYLLPKIIQTNELLRTFVDEHDNMHWIEIFEHMLSPDGRPKTDLFVEDMLHLNLKGYKIWKQQVREQLIV
ncbi:GDSL-type esterase/lipase family protein [Reichenbachiella agarivorans]|uniref:GDSL-type esterase/lipase family protein n=1 Tax=Reichenbachiella agarivorans TaxID=2979464 RepID=A0ABY6CSE4_9BACT|nr:GDSL-type esterase/lipase family protein [Reichenbachiella agarivorans]UXP33444.1 GDSL-type esterase/lipase family protein [Reichenbachiella agarivorans]